MDSCKFKHLNLGKHRFKITQHYSMHMQCENLLHSMGMISQFLFSKIFQSMTRNLRINPLFLMYMKVVLLGFSMVFIA